MRARGREGSIILLISLYRLAFQELERNGNNHEGLEHVCLKMIFNNVDEILNFHREPKTCLAFQQIAQGDPGPLKDLFSREKDHIKKAYAKYCRLNPCSMFIYHNQSNGAYSKFLKGLEAQLPDPEPNEGVPNAVRVPLDTLLQKPVLRFGQLRMLLAATEKKLQETTFIRMR